MIQRLRPRRWDRGLLSVLDLEFFGIGLEYAKTHAQISGQVIAPHRNNPV